MRRKFTRNSIWSDKEEEYARCLREGRREKVVVAPDAILSPGERYTSATLRMPRVVAEFKLSRIEKSVEGIVLVFEKGRAVFEYADMTDFVRERNLLHFAFGGGLLDVVIGEDK